MRVLNNVDLIACLLCLLPFSSYGIEVDLQNLQNSLNELQKIVPPGAKLKLTLSQKQRDDLKKWASFVVWPPPMEVDKVSEEIVEKINTNDDKAIRILIYDHILQELNLGEAAKDRLKEILSKIYDEKWRRDTDSQAIYDLVSENFQSGELVPVSDSALDPVFMVFSLVSYINSGNGFNRLVDKLSRPKKRSEGETSAKPKLMFFTGTFMTSSYGAVLHLYDLQDERMASTKELFEYGFKRLFYYFRNKENRAMPIFKKGDGAYLNKNGVEFPILDIPNKLMDLVSESVSDAQRVKVALEICAMLLYQCSIHAVEGYVPYRTTLKSLAELSPDKRLEEMDSKYLDHWKSFMKDFAAKADGLGWKQEDDWYNK